jgi:hypothetical protein
MKTEKRAEEVRQQEQKMQQAIEGEGKPVSLVTEVPMGQELADIYLKHPANESSDDEEGEENVPHLTEEGRPQLYAAGNGKLYNSITKCTHSALMSLLSLLLSLDIPVWTLTSFRSFSQSSPFIATSFQFFTPRALIYTILSLISVWTFQFSKIFQVR